MEQRPPWLLRTSPRHPGASLSQFPSTGIPASVSVARAMLHRSPALCTSRRRVPPQRCKGITTCCKGGGAPVFVVPRLPILRFTHAMTLRTWRRYYSGAQDHWCIRHGGATMNVASGDHKDRLDRISPCAPAVSQQDLSEVLGHAWFFHDPAQILTVRIVGRVRRQRQQAIGIDVAFAIRDLLDAADLQPLAVLDRLDKIACFQ